MVSPTELVANVHRNVGLVANFSATFANTEFVDTLSGRRFNARVLQISVARWPTLQLAKLVRVHSLRARAVWRRQAQGRFQKR